MARIAGVDLPNNKQGEIGLTYIFGIGRSSAQKNMDKVHAHLAGDIAQQDVTVLKLYFEHSVGKGLDNLSILFYCYLF